MLEERDVVVGPRRGDRVPDAVERGVLRLALDRDLERAGLVRLARRRAVERGDEPGARVVGVGAPVEADHADGEAVGHQLFAGSDAMSASAESVSRSIARSPSETIPAARPSCSTMMRRTFCSRTSRIASSTLWSTVSLTGLMVAPSLTRVASGSSPWATTRTAMSRSV